MLNPVNSYQVAEYRIQEMHREADQARLVNEALRIRREQEAALGLPPRWQRVPAALAGSALAGSGRFLLRAGEWLRARYTEPRTPCCDPV